MKATVTGHRGFIGSHLTTRLIAEGWDVTGIDLPDHDLLDELIITKPDVLFHLAATPGVRASWDNDTQDDLTIMQRILYSLIGTGTRLVFASSSSAKNPISPYGVSKAACELMISAYADQHGIHATSLRYHTVYGPRQREDMAFHRWIEAALTGRPLLVHGHHLIRDFTYVSDVVNATILAGGAHPPDQHRIFDVATGNPKTISLALDIIAELTGAELDIRYGSRQPGDPRRTAGEIIPIEKAYGWTPKVELREGLERQVAWHRGQG